MTGFIWLYNFRVYLEDYYPDLNKHDLKKINTESGTFHTRKRTRHRLRSEPQLYLVPSTSRCLFPEFPEFVVSGKNPKEVLKSTNLQVTNEYGANFLPQNVLSLHQEGSREGTWQIVRAGGRSGWKEAERRGLGDISAP